MDITLRHIGKSYKHQPVLESIGFAVNARELVSIVGPSGAGKTTLLKIIAGLETPDQGEVAFSEPVSKHHPVIIVFQDYVLFPAMTVRQNIGFGLKARHMEKNQIKNQVDRMLDYFKLAPQADQYPAQLSAGQKQRVAIARAMIVNPAVLLLDEPFANLDRNLKMETARFIRTTQQAFGIPTISVTHDLEEAFAMSDRIGVLLDGRVQQFDTPRQVYFHSATPAVARFLFRPGPKTWPSLQTRRDSAASRKKPLPATTPCMWWPQAARLTPYTARMTGLTGISPCPCGTGRFNV
jgi:putative spermidine/putrescine transport system ATP-binding protein